MCNLSKGVEEKGIQKGIKKGIQKGIEKGIEQGIEQGSLKATKAIAFNMKAKGLDPQTISQYTGLSLKEIAIL